MKLVSMLLTLLLAAPLTVSAAVSAKFQQWAQGPVHFLFTPDEQRAWGTLQDDQQAIDFIQLFWARRDPTPETPENELRHEFDQRVAFADQHFPEEGKRGALSDRGRVFIILGPPKRSTSEAERSSSAFETQRNISRNRAAQELGAGGAVRGDMIWTYEHQQLPTVIPKRGLEATFHWQLATHSYSLVPRTNVQHALDAAIQDSIKRPKLTLADLAPGMTASSGVTAWKSKPLAQPDAVRQSLEEALAQGHVPGVQASLDAHLFRAADGSWIVPLQVAVPEKDGSSAGALHMIVRVLDGQGKQKTAFESPTQWKTSPRERVDQNTVALVPGDYTIQVGLMDASGSLVWADSAKVSVPANDKEFWLSDLLLSDNLYNLKEKQAMLQPYAWQGVAMIPMGNSTFAVGDSMWLYLHACNPTLDAGGKPSFTVIVQLKGEREFRGPMEVQPIEIGANCWVIAQALELRKEMFVPGDYEIMMQVTDNASHLTKRSSRAFHLVAAATAAPQSGS